MSSNSTFEIINAVVPDPLIFFWIAASVAATAADNPNGNKTTLARDVSTIFINGKLAVINSLRKFESPHSCFVVFLVLPFNKILLFSKDSITF